MKLLNYKGSIYKITDLKQIEYQKQRPRNEIIKGNDDDNTEQRKEDNWLNKLGQLNSKVKINLNRAYRQ